MIYDKIGPIIPRSLKIVHLPPCGQAADSRARRENELEIIE
jgi:hypothetical protein